MTTKHKYVAEPLGWMVSVKVDRKKTKTAGGIYLDPNSCKVEDGAGMVGTVLGIGPYAFLGSMDVSGTGKPWVNVGDRIIFKQYCGTIIPDTDNDESYERHIEDKYIVARLVSTTAATDGMTDDLLDWDTLDADLASQKRNEVKEKQKLEVTQIAKTEASYYEKIR
jgi:co-chaperonin GroES (HSP10)